MMLSRAGRNFAGRVNRATERWRGPVAAGCIAAAILWLIWYFTRPPCTMASAAQGMCHPGLVAQYINHQIAAQCMLVGMAATTLKGGYDQLMLNRERKRADEAEERLAEERRRNDERMETLYAELRQERQHTIWPFSSNSTRLPSSSTKLPRNITRLPSSKTMPSSSKCWPPSRKP